MEEQGTDNPLSVYLFVRNMCFGSNVVNIPVAVQAITQFLPITSPQFTATINCLTDYLLDELHSDPIERKFGAARSTTEEAFLVSRTAAPPNEFCLRTSTCLRWTRDAVQMEPRARKQLIFDSIAALISNWVEASVPARARADAPQPPSNGTLQAVGCACEFIFAVRRLSTQKPFLGIAINGIVRARVLMTSAEQHHSAGHEESRVVLVR